MSNDPKVIVVHCDALSYSGTTWLNLTLGAHDKALTIGPTHRIWDQKDSGFDQACLVHDGRCEFWAGFADFWDGEENMLLALSRYSGRTHFFFDNPNPEFVEAYMQDPAVQTVRLRYLRDARAISASFARKMPDTPYYDSILPSGWLYHSFQAIPAPSAENDVQYIYYEACAKNAQKIRHEVGPFIGLDYSDGGHRFWEADHHITMGNTGPINMVRLHQGLDVPAFESRDVYIEQYKRLQSEPDKPFFDERWRKQLSREDLFYFDILMGEKNAELGYDRDRFTDSEIATFVANYRSDVDAGIKAPLPQDALNELERRAALGSFACAPEMPTPAPSHEAISVDREQDIPHAASIPLVYCSVSALSDVAGRQASHLAPVLSRLLEIEIGFVANVEPIRLPLSDWEPADISRAVEAARGGVLLIGVSPVDVASQSDLLAVLNTHAGTTASVLACVDTSPEGAFGLSETMSSDDVAKIRETAAFTIFDAHDALAAQPDPSRGLRLENGAWSHVAHYNLARYLSANMVDLVSVLAQQAAALAPQAPAAAAAVPDAAPIAQPAPHIQNVTTVPAHFNNTRVASVAPVTTDPAKPYPETIFRSEPDAHGNRLMVPPIGPGIRAILDPTTQYYDGVDPERAAAVRPYNVEASTYSRDDVEKLIVSANMQLGYGPDYTAKHPASLTVDPLTRYRDLLESMSAQEGLEFKTFAEGLGSPPPADKVIGLIRHDVDGDLVAALDMAKLEAAYSISSTYFLLHTAPYYAITTDGVTRRNEESVSIYKEIEALGHEIGIHTDALELYQTHLVNGSEALQQEIEWLRQQGLRIRGTLAHNSFNVYGANNYTIFKGRPLTDYYYPGEARSVIHNGKWAPLQELDEIALDLEYEGNDVFWQNETPVQYYCLMHQGMWVRTKDLYGTLQHVQDRPKQVTTWVSQEDVIDDLRARPNGTYAVIVVHPLHYGQRAHKHDAPHAAVSRIIDAHTNIFATGTNWLDAMTLSTVGERLEVEKHVPDTETGRTCHIVTGLSGERVEFTGVHVPNDAGEPDRPLAYLDDAAIRMAFLGGENFKGKSLAADSRIAQLTVQYLKHAHGLHTPKVAASTFSATPFDSAALKNAMDYLGSKRVPDIVFVGLGEEHLSGGAAADIFSDLNEAAGTQYSVFGIVERAGLTRDHISQSLESYDPTLAEALRGISRFQVFDPFEQFAFYAKSGSGKLYWDSVDEWAPQAHHLAARLLADNLIDFVTHMIDSKSPSELLSA